MKRNELLGLTLAVLGTVAGCGDNSDTCGPGTMAVDGVCTPTGVTATCTDGTILNVTTNQCEIDPASCQDGTVLINNKCQDPTAGLTIDLEEGAEPNGLNVGEASTAGAGAITLKPIGSSFVIHGHITPFQDVDADGISDADFDTYEVAITSPTYLEVTADGVHGLLGAFIVSGAPNGEPYRRFGLNLTGDTSKRKIFLPSAGTWTITIGDTRSMFLDGNSPPAAGFGGAAGGPDAEYFVSVTALAIPAAIPLTPDATGIATDAGTGATGIAVDADLKFYTVPMGLGFNDIQFNMPQVSANASVIVTNNGAFSHLADESVDPFFGDALPAETVLGGLNPTDTTLIVGDYTWNYGPEAADYTLRVQTQTATALKTDGTSTAAVLEVNSDPSVDGDSVFDFNLFYYDVNANGEIDGMKLHWNHPVDGVLVDSNLQPIASFTGLNGDVFQDYNGLLRHPAPGRYYFAVYDPAGTPGTDSLAATSTISVFATPTDIVLGTPTATVTNNVFNSTPFTFDEGTTVAWQQHGVTKTGTGTLNVAFLDPTTAFGRLDTLTINPGAGSSVAADEVTPVFTDVFGAAGPAKGRIVLDDVVTSFIVKVNTTTATTTSTYALNFEARKSPVSGTTFGDFGTVTATPTVISPNTLAAGDKMFFLAKSTPGGLVKLIATPTGAVKPDVVLTSLNADESPDLAIQTVGTGAETGTFAAHTGGWVAVEVTGAVSAVTTGTFDISAAVGATVTYINSSPTVPFVSICNGVLNDVTMTPDDTFFGLDGDEALSNALPVPAGFTYFGASVGSLQVSTNGWLSFQIQPNGQTDAHFVNVSMPDPGAPNAMIAPYWDDLDAIEVCTKTIGSTMTVEWQGETIGGDAIAFQVQLNATTGTITFVYGAAQVADGVKATVGIEDFAGATASLLEFNTAASVAPSTAKRFTPN